MATGARDQAAVMPRPRLRVSNLNSSSDELAGVSFADEDFEQSQFGLDVLVFVVLLGQRGAVLFLHVSTETAKQKKEPCVNAEPRGKTNVCC